MHILTSEIVLLIGNKVRFEKVSHIFNRTQSIFLFLLRSECSSFRLSLMLRVFLSPSFSRAQSISLSQFLSCSEYFSLPISLVQRTFLSTYLSLVIRTIIILLQWTYQCLFPVCKCIVSAVKPVWYESLKELYEGKETTRPSRRKPSA